MIIFVLDCKRLRELSFLWNELAYIFLFGEGLDPKCVDLLASGFSLLLDRFGG
jgi:hypothetical protein